jgi:hypothetical protein
MSEKEISFDALILTIKKFVNYSYKFKVLGVLIVLIGTITGFCYAHFSKVLYEAKISFIINDSKSSSQNPLAALASQFNVGVSSANVTEDKVLFLIGTKRILGQALLTEYDNKKITLADKLLSNWEMKKEFKNDADILNFKGFENKKIDKINYTESKILDIIISKIIKSNKLLYEPVKKKSTSFVTQSSSGIILISFKNDDEILSKLFVEAIYDNLSDFYIKSITKSLKNNLDLVSRREDSLNAVMISSDYKLAEEIDNAFGVYKFKGRIPQNRLKKDNELISLMYAEVLKNKEIAKFNLDQEKPVLQVIDGPMLPLQPYFKSKVIYSTIGLILSSIIFLVLMFILFIKKT